MIKFQIHKICLWLLVCVFTTIGVTAKSASLNLITEGPISSAVADFDYFDGGELVGFDIAFTSGPEDGNLASIFFDPLLSIPPLIDLEGELGDIVAFGFLDNLIELQVDPFANYTFGALITLSNFAFNPGEDPIAEIVNAGDATYFDINVDLQAIAAPTTPIPLGSSSIFLLFGAFIFAGLRQLARLSSA